MILIVKTIIYRGNPSQHHKSWHATITKFCTNLVYHKIWTFQEKFKKWFLIYSSRNPNILVQRSKMNPKLAIVHFMLPTLQCRKIAIPQKHMLEKNFFCPKPFFGNLFITTYKILDVSMDIWLYFIIFLALKSKDVLEFWSCCKLFLTILNKCYID